MQIETVEKMNFERGDIVVLKISGDMSGEDWTKLMRWCQHLKDDRQVFPLPTGCGIELEKMNKHELRELVIAAKRILQEIDPITNIENLNHDACTVDTPRGILTMEQIEHVIRESIARNGPLGRIAIEAARNEIAKRQREFQRYEDELAQGR